MPLARKTDRDATFGAAAAIKTGRRRNGGGPSLLKKEEERRRKRRKEGGEGEEEEGGRGKGEGVRPAGGQKFKNSPPISKMRKFLTPKFDLILSQILKPQIGALFGQNFK